MAIQTKTISANGSKGHHKFTLKVNEETTSSNSSFMSYSFTIAPIQNGWDWYGHNIPYSVKIGSNTYTGSISNYNGSSTVTISSGSNIEIAHNTDGTKTIDISFTVTDNTGQSYTCGSASSSSTFKLTDLHKSPVVSISSVTERNSLLTNVPGTTIVNSLSIKRFVLSIQTFDSATITADNIDVTEQGTLPLKSTISISGNNVTIDIDFNEQSLISSSLTSLKTKIMFFIMDSKSGVNITYTPEYDVIPYQKPNLIQTSSSVKRNGQTTGKAKLNLVGKMYNGTIGNITNNLTLYYKYWKNEDTEPSDSTYTTIPKTETISGTTKTVYSIDSNGNITMSESWEIKKNNTEITDLDQNYNYKFKIKAIDSFSKEHYIELNLPKGKYIMAKFKDRVDFLKITVGGYNPFEYSTNEIIVGKWVDDKPIYKKVIDIGNLPNASQTIVSHNISNIKRIVKLYGSATRDSDKDTMPIPYVTFNSNNSGGINLYANNVSVLVSTSTDRSSYTGYVVLEYTKTSD